MIDLAGKRAFDRVHLTAQPAHPVDQTALVAERAGGCTFVIRMAHGSNLKPSRCMLHGSRPSRRIGIDRAADH